MALEIAAFPGVIKLEELMELEALISCFLVELSLFTLTLT